MITFKESNNNMKVKYIMTCLPRYYSDLYTHKPFASLVDLELNVDRGMAETGSWHCMSGGVDR